MTEPTLDESPSGWEQPPPPISDSAFTSQLSYLHHESHADLSDVTISSKQTDTLVRELKQSKNGRLNLSGSWVEGDLDLSDVELVSGSDFTATRFLGNANFANARVTGRLRFEESQFHGDVSFRHAKLGDFGGSFSSCVFKRRADFADAVVTGDLAFKGSIFELGATFNKTTFNDEVDFSGAVFNPDESIDDSKPPLFTATKFNAQALFMSTWFYRGAIFESAEFNSRCTFGQFVSRGGPMDFSNLVFEQHANFTDGTAGGDITFFNTKFMQSGHFHLLEVHGDADFDQTEFDGIADFRQSSFHADLDFADAILSDVSGIFFDDSTVDGNANFRKTSFGADASFFHAKLHGDVDFSVAKFVGDANFRTFHLGRSANFGEARFVERVEFESVRKFDGGGARFEQGFRISSMGGDLALENVRIGGPSLVEPASELDTTYNPLTVPIGFPWVTDLRRTNVESLSLSGCELGRCKFQNAHGLSEIGIEGGSMFGRTPDSSFKRRSWITRRAVIAEEREWWVARGANGWTPPVEETESDEISLPELDGFIARSNTRVATPPQALLIAASYRALRRGLEARRETELAGDFYYGEMQMRRKGVPDWPLRMLLTIYWALSGYGTRAVRALAWLALTIGLFVAAFHTLNVVEGPQVGLGRSKAIVLAFGSSINFLKAPSDSLHLNTNGEMLTIILHLVSVLLAALFVLALRARVKR